MKFIEEFKRPPSEFRGKPFWAWNGKLEKEEACRQIDVFKEMGLGGAFMHSRVGLDTAYLSKEWFDVVSACVERARKNGMEMWLYDEDRWPSGAAGGLVTKDPRYRLRHLRMDVVEAKDFKPSSGALALFAAKVSDRDASSVRRIGAKDAQSLKPQEKILAFSVELMECNSWYNGYTYLDTMSVEAVDKFIEVTHAAYAKHNGKDFGKLIPGIFTDEPEYGRGGYKDGIGKAQWTDKLPETFKSRYGYDIIDHLPELFFVVDGKALSKARRDYRECATFMFDEAFGRRIFEFCESNKLLFTGHLMEEASLMSQVNAVGACMRFYEYMQAPGIDILCAQGLTREGGRDMEILTAKQCESMRRQFGRKWMLSELYGCTGWNFSFAEHKAVGDWQAAMGINLRCQHLSWYTMKGDAKRDYPASISYQSAWWKDYPVVEDYFSRVNVALTQGEAVRDLAVLHPIESVWSSYVPYNSWDGGAPGVNSVTEALDKALVDTQRMLLGSHFDFDYVDEDVMARHGSAADGQLKISLAKYKAVLVPPLLHVKASTVKLLEEFVKSGGSIVMLQNPKELAKVEDKESLAALRSIASACAFSGKALEKALLKLPLRRASIGAKAGQYPDCLYMLRRDEKSGLTILFVTHSRQDKDSGPLEIKVPASGKVFEFNAATGDILSVKDAAVKGGQTVFKTSLPAYGSRLFIIEDAGLERIQATSSKLFFKKSSRKPLSLKNCEFTLSEQNAFPIDMADCNLGRGWVGTLEVLMLDRAIRDACDLPHRGGQMVQPWAREPRKGFVKRHAEISYGFKAEFIPESPVWLVMESPSEFKCKVNGSEVQLKDEGWWIDKSFRRVKLPKGAVKEGWNQILLSTEYGPDSGIEAIYIQGDFGFRREADGKPVMTSMPKRLGLGDWTKYNLSSYTGGLGYVAEIGTKLAKGERLFVELPAWEGVMAKILVDGKPVGDVAWPPFELDITDAVAGKSKCKLEIRIVAGRRGLLGPFHLTYVPTWTGPGQFVSTGWEWTSSYNPAPAGLMKAPLLTVKS